MNRKQFWAFNQNDKETILSLLAKGKREQETNSKFAVINFDDFWKLFSDDEVVVIKKYLAIDPKNVGYKLPFLGLEDTPSDIVAIPDQEYLLDGEIFKIPCQYLPKTTFEAYTKLNQTIYQETRNKLLVLYGYRSPARQVFMFFDILQRIYDFDFNKTIQRVCFPAYSEHVCPHQQAIDFVTKNGVKGDGFENTDEYQWLLSNAGKFGFNESYPIGNDLNMMYEPWHWCFRLGGK
jgi:hypothetical protein